MQVKPPGDEVTVYEVIELAPPKSDGAVNETVAAVFSPETEVILGAVGALAATVIVTCDEEIAL